MNKRPRIEKSKDGFHFLVDNEPYILLAGEVHNSACSSYEYMQHVWDKAKMINCNTVLAPVYWESLEREENLFDFSIPRMLIQEAGKHDLKLVFLWFGSWKNGHSTYVPQWMKTDVKRFPRVEDEQGVKTRTLSMFGSEIFDVEERAFGKLMQFIKEYDSDRHTVLAVQIENEVGLLGTDRDYSGPALDAFRKEIPDQLKNLLKKEGMDLPQVGDRPLSWENVFQEKANEAFMCWSYAVYIDRLAGAGKSIYDIPMFTNVWMKAENEAPGSYPCGGPVYDMVPIWKAAATHLDAVSPDIYSFNFEEIAEYYARNDNPLFIPETRRDKWAPANLYAAIGTFHTLCYAPFGLESIGENKSYITQIMHTDPLDKNVSSELVETYLSKSYGMLRNMIPVLTKYYGTDQMVGFVQDTMHMEQKISLGEYQIRIEFYHAIDEEDRFIPAAGIVILEEQDRLMFLGYGYRAYPETTKTDKQLDFLSLEKGIYDVSGSWKKTMDLNGDEQYIRMEEMPTIMKAKFYEF